MPVWEFELTPKPEAAVVWGRIEYRVRKNDLMPIWACYYDEDSKLVRTLEFAEFRAVSGRTVPMLMSMTPADKPREVTRVRYTSLEFNVPVEASFFSLQNLKAR
jgi:hypothetical protein